MPDYILEVIMSMLYTFLFLSDPFGILWCVVPIFGVAFVMVIFNWLIKFITRR